MRSKREIVHSDGLERPVDDDDDDDNDDDDDDDDVFIIVHCRR